MKPSVVLNRVFREIVAEAERNPAFGDKLREALIAALPVKVAVPKAAPTAAGAQTKKSRRRAPGPFDPFAVCRTEGVQALRARLTALTLDELKDIVSEHAMDGSRLALKWKAAERLIDMIVTTVVDRSSKGDAFRETPIGPRAT